MSGSRDRKRKAEDGQINEGEGNMPDLTNNPPVLLDWRTKACLVTMAEIHDRGIRSATLDSDSSVKPCSSSSSSRIMKNPPSINANAQTESQDGSTRAFANWFMKNGIAIRSQNGHMPNETAPGPSKQNVVEAKGNSSGFLEENVFSIAHILEQILSKLDEKALFASRLVCVRWAYFGAKALQKIVTIRLQQSSTFPTTGGVRKPGWTRHRLSYRLTTGKEISLEPLSTCIAQSAEFPCTSFLFKRKDVHINPITQIFLQNHGPFITKIEFDGWVRLIDLKQLLFTLAPNLQQLLLKNTDDVAMGTDYTPPNKRLTRHTGSSCLDETFGCPQQPTLQKLKVFTCSRCFPQEFVQYILELSPNLVEVWLPTENLHFLVKPVHRLYLLKTLEADIDEEDIKPLECVANLHENNLTLSRIQFRLCSKNKDLYPRAVDVMSKILVGSSATCQNLTLECDLDFTLPRMPAMKHLSLNGRQRKSSRVHLFQRWINLADTFPNLRSLTIEIVILGPNTDSLFGQIVPAQITSVKDVYLKGQEYEDKVVQRFQQMFPNASVHNHIVIRDRDSDSDESRSSFGAERDRNSGSRPVSYVLERYFRSLED